ncbi:MAG: ATPase, partial [Bacteroidales bacterium]
MRIIADSGSTKTNWYVLHPDGKIQTFQSKGLNPYIVCPGEVYKEIKNNFPDNLSALQVNELYFYGAGCSGSVQKECIYSGLERFFLATIIHVFHDLLGAARSLWGQQHGLIAILGTGASTALYDGKKVSEQVPSLGYILGDEGSGAYLGKILLKSFLQNDMPIPLAKKFSKVYGANLSDFLQHVY